MSFPAGVLRPRDQLRAGVDTPKLPEQSFPCGHPVDAKRGPGTALCTTTPFPCIEGNPFLQRPEQKTTRLDKESSAFSYIQAGARSERSRFPRISPGCARAHATRAACRTPRGNRSFHAGHGVGVYDGDFPFPDEALDRPDPLGKVPDGTGGRAPDAGATDRRTDRNPVNQAFDEHGDPQTAREAGHRSFRMEPGDGGAIIFRRCAPGA
jgi:hypothetical protein